MFTLGDKKRAHHAQCGYRIISPQCEPRLTEAESVYVKSKECLKEGGFNLRKFRSNCEQLEEKIFEKFPDDKKFTGEDKILGINWVKKSDRIRYSFNDIRSKFIEEPTRRSILASIASIYDPLGLISPITVKMKTFYQKVCDLKFKWDEKLSYELFNEWNTMLDELSEIDCIELDRNYCFHF